MNVNHDVTNKTDWSKSTFYAYHRQTKHSLASLTGGEHYLDWANQPDPFRKYPGAVSIELPRDIEVNNLGYFQALELMLSGQGVLDSQPWTANAKPDLSFVSNLLFYSMAVSAWKEIRGTNHRWALRVNPSSGNLHPTETHLLVQSIAGLDAGIYHYRVSDHYLEQRALGNQAESIWASLTGNSKCPPLIVCLTSIFWRESWKYRDRAYRYCQHDIGHAMASILLSAGALGFTGQILGQFPDKEVAQSLGLKGLDEKPALIIGLWPDNSGAARQEVPFASPLNIERMASQHSGFARVDSEFSGQPNVLSGEEVLYRSIDTVYDATCMSVEDWQRQRSFDPPVSDPLILTGSMVLPEVKVIYNPGKPGDQAKVSQVIRRRRSAVDLDGQQSMNKDDLGTILVSASRGFHADFQKPIAWESDKREADGHFLVHLFLYIHRVHDVNPGTYYFDRLRKVLIPIVHKDQRAIAKYMSCFQDIAADGCFAISMIANLGAAYQYYGERAYRFVHYEAGCIGQWLYLSSQALGFEATGIGCFLDDEINQHLSLPPGWESIYNFTVGRAVLDSRLTTRQAYDFSDPTVM